jgi:hypothetical protein
MGGGVLRPGSVVLRPPVVEILLPGIAVGPPTLAAPEHWERLALVRRNK